jgi:hypothetical protein
MASAFAFVYQKEFLKGFRDHTLQPLTEGDNSPHLKLSPHYVRPNVRFHTGQLDAIAAIGSIRDERHMHQIQHQATQLGKHMGDRMMGYHA